MFGRRARLKYVQAERHPFVCHQPHQYENIFLFYRKVATETTLILYNEYNLNINKNRNKPHHKLIKYFEYDYSAAQFSLLQSPNNSYNALEFYQMENQIKILLNFQNTLNSPINTADHSFQKKNNTYKKQQQFNDFQQPAFNVAELQIKSPFYDKNKLCTAINCKCPYHKRQWRITTSKYQTNIKTKVVKKNLAKRSQLQVSPITKQTQQQWLHQKIYFRTANNSPLKAIDEKSMVNSFNIDFEQFLKEHNQILQKSDLESVSKHKIRIGVNAIFRYLYDNLNKQKSEIQQYINKVQRDRDLNRFYIERFIEMKQKWMQKSIKSRKQNHASKISSIIQIPKGLNFGKQKEIRKSKRISTNFNYEQPVFKKKTQKFRPQRLCIQTMLSMIDSNQPITDNQLHIFANLREDQFAQNITYLKNNLFERNRQSLLAIKRQIVQRSIKIFDEEKNNSQMKQMQKINILINKLIQDGSDSEFQSEMDNPQSIRASKIQNYRASNASSRKNRVSVLNPNQMILDSSSEESQDEKQDDENIKTNLLRSNTIFKYNQIDQDNAEPSFRQQIRENLAKYRRFSHDNFFHKKFLQEEDDDNRKQLDLLIYGSIDEKLQELRSKLTQRAVKIKQLQIKFNDMMMNEVLVKEQDSLITVKRKMGVFKKLLRQDGIDESIKKQVNEYLKYIEDKNYVKNKNWAYKKIKNFISFDNDVEIYEQEQTQLLQCQFDRIINDIFSDRSLLRFYHIFKTSYVEPQINFDCLFDQIKSKQDEYLKKTKRKITRIISREDIVETKKNVYEEGYLIQTGLDNHFVMKYPSEEEIALRQNHRLDRWESQDELEALLFKMERYI